MNEQELHELIRKYLAGTASVEEKGLVESWYRSVNDATIEVPMASETEEREMEASMLHRLQASMLTEDVGTPEIPVQGVHALRRRVWVGWAAAIVLLLGMATYIWTIQQKKTPPAIAQTTPLQHDALPGGNKAILTLGSGQKVVLDSATQDTVLTEGSAIVAGAEGKLAYNVGNTPEAAPVYNTLSTPRGGQYQLTLPDGTKVWLNAASSITYPTAFEGNERSVSVTGEAYFEVATDPGKPFKVQVNQDAEVQVLGTHFNINAYEDEPVIATTLLEGRIRFVQNWGDKKAPFVELKPGQQIQLSKSDDVRLIDHADVEQAVAWKNGVFKLSGSSIQEIMRQVSRWYDVNVRYEGNLEKSVFGGMVTRRENVSKLLEVLETTGTVHFQIQDKTIIVKP